MTQDSGSPANNHWERRAGLVCAGFVILAFIYYVFNPPASGDASNAIIRFLAAMTAGLSATLFIGTLEIQGRQRQAIIKATGGFAIALIVLVLFFYGIPSAPSQFPTDAEVSVLPAETTTWSSRATAIDNQSADPVERAEGLITEFRDQLIEWYEPIPVSVKEGNGIPKMEDDVENKLTDIINQLGDDAFLDVDLLSQARISFYSNFWSDFRTRVLRRTGGAEDSPLLCEKASKVYHTPVEKYLSYFESEESNGKVIQDEDFFIIIELGHWLMNRDAGVDDYVMSSNSERFDGYETALRLYSHLDPNAHKQALQYNFYASRGLANAKLGFIPEARKDFELALKIDNDASDLQYNAASIDAQESNYDTAIRAYRTAIEKYENASADDQEHAKVKPATLNRDLGWTYLLRGLNKEKRPNSDGSADFDKAIAQFNTLINNSNFSKMAHAGKALAIHYLGNAYQGTSSVSAELALAGDHEIAESARLITSGTTSDLGLLGITKRYAFGNFVPHDLEAEPVLDIFHGDFYCEGGTPRTE